MSALIKSNISLVCFNWPTLLKMNNFRYKEFTNMLKTELSVTMDMADTRHRGLVVRMYASY